MKLIVIANWKMNPSSLNEARQLFAETKKCIRKSRRVELIVFPPAVFLAEFRRESSKVKLGGQNCHWEDKGAFTGEISPKQLKSLGCKYVILGHSERRQFFQEGDEMINRKIKAALKNKLKIVFCVGETDQEKEAGITQEVLMGQMRDGLRGVSRREIESMIVAYEPSWAIGTGLAYSVGDAQVMNLFLKKIISQQYSLATARKMPILYGGSVNHKNVRDYILEAGMSGVILGGGSLDAKELGKIIESLK
ncbi:MAG: Triosephosphate isomerase [Parcubacteria group bacterium GW2011_GWC1_38_6]|nr:MAG: Triosephosphate isomerase [Parcubacteria group bacterium GW2011_GWA1_36_12]KKQ77307.1 MAG: Triosephosphate isomerase [Parcubacteria group bacterium GW2011_GWC1_38_6]